MHKKFKNENAETLYRLIVSLHMKQSKVAIQIGLSPATLTNYLKENNNPSFETEYKVKQYLKREDIREMIEVFVR